MRKLSGLLVFSALISGILTSSILARRLSGQEMTFDDAVELAGQAFEANWAKIQSGEGAVKIRMERTILKPYPTLGKTVAGAPQPPGDGVFQADVRCYFQGDVFRNDYESRKPEPGVKELFFQRKEREVHDPEKRIYYDLIGGYAYINDPYRENFGRLNVHDWFEPRAYLKPVGDDVPAYEALRRMVERGGTASPPRWKEINGKKLLELEVVKPSKRDPNRRLCRRAYLDPELGWLMTRYEVLRFGNSLDSAKDMELINLYQVEYKEHAEGIWFPKKVEWQLNFDYFGDQVVAEYSDFRLNCQLPPETFTFKGLGVPPGTLVIDKRGGAELTYYYGRLPEKKMEKLLEDVVDFEKKLDMGLEETEPLPRAAEPRKPGMASPSGETSPATPTAPAVTTSPALWPYITLGIAVVLVIGGLIVLLLKRRRAAGG